MNEKILVVEDVADTVKMFQDLLVREGYDVHIAKDGENVLKSA